MTVADEKTLFDEARAALAHWPRLASAKVAPLGRGLINRTYLVTAGDERFVLQRVNAIFDPAIHYNIAAVTARLAEVGLETPRLVDNEAGAPLSDLGAGGVWRVMTFIDGATFDVAQGAVQARNAGHLIARFHAALDGLKHEFVGLRLGVHDTPRHLATLRAALTEHTSHRLFAVVRPLGESILDAASKLAALPSLPPRACHGDLKFNNLLFHAAEPTRPRCLVDLDTVGPLALAFELGDAWRSWCNPSGEDATESTFDLDIYGASLDGYLDGLGRSLTTDERAALVGGVEWISLELSARFCADALRECYFGWNAERFPGRGEHNLARARSQWSLHGAVMRCRRERARPLGS